jgi:integrase
MPKKLSNALTPLTVKNAKPGRYADGGGLQLLVKEPSAEAVKNAKPGTPAVGARAWVYRYMLKGRSRDMGLGPAAGPGAVALTKARDLADDLRKLVKAGIDPLDLREQSAAEAAAAAQAATIAGITFKSVAETYIGSNEASWRTETHRQQWRNTLASYVYPVIGELPVADIGTAHVLTILEPIWQGKPETASRIRGRIETVLDAAKARGYRDGENPARWRGHIQQILPARSRLSRGHHKAMSYEALPAFVAQLREREAMAALALEFVILTASRTSEVLGATWSEIDLEKAIWTIPANRMKAGKEHRVPLSPRVVEILEHVKPLNKLNLFPSDEGSKLSTMAMAMLLRRMKQDCTVHGFRSAFRDWAAECTGFSHEVCEMALAHVIGNKAEAAYRRGDLFEKRRKLMEAWATRCSTIDAAGDNVTPIRGDAAA